jgi:hypothetical protein
MDSAQSGRGDVIHHLPKHFDFAVAAGFNVISSRD